MIRHALCSILLTAVALALGCGSEEPATSKPKQAAPEPTRAAPAPPPQASAPATPDELPNGIVLALAQFKIADGKPQPGAARLEFLVRTGGKWRMTSLEDPESNVFHKAMLYEGAEGPRILTMGGTAAIVKTWTPGDAGLVGTSQWQQDFGGKWSRMRDAEIADLYGDGAASIAVATHDQGVVAVLRPKTGGGFEAIELDRQPDTFVHEIEVGDLDGDGVPEVYATPSEPWWRRSAIATPRRSWWTTSMATAAMSSTSPWRGTWARTSSSSIRWRSAATTPAPRPRRAP